MKIPAPVVIFVRPQAAGNIGALARAMSNFGCRELRIVGEDPAKDQDPTDSFATMDWALAKRGEGILEQATWHADLASALTGVHLTIGSSGRDMEFERGYARPLVGPQEAFETLAQWQSKAAEESQTERSSAALSDSVSDSVSPFVWAFVLGPEDDGLTDHESALCQKLIRIPTEGDNASLNVAMAASMIFYHRLLFNQGLQAAADATDAGIGGSAASDASVAGSRAPQENSRAISAADPGAIGASHPPRRDSGAFLPPERKTRLHSTETGRELWATQDQRESFLRYTMETLARTDFLKYPDHDAVAARLRRWLQSALIPVGELLFAFEIVYHLRAWGSGEFEQRDFLKR